MEKPDYKGIINGHIERSRNAGYFMAHRHPNYKGHEPGALARLSKQRRGIELPDLQHLVATTTIRKGDDPRGQDWLAPGPGQPFRWSGPSPKPKILIAFSGDGMVRFTLDVHAMMDETSRGLAVKVNGKSVGYRLFTPAGTDPQTLAFDARLLPDRHTIIELHAPTGLHNGRPRGIAVGDIHLARLE